MPVTFSLLASATRYTCFVCSGLSIFLAARLMHGGCATCASDLPWVVPWVSGTVWAVLGWSFPHLPLVISGVICAQTVAHGAFIVTEWDGACLTCVSILLVEVICVLCACWALRRIPSPRTPATIGACLIAFLLGGVLFGHAALPRIVFGSCSDGFQRVQTPSLESGLLLFTLPKCDQCERLKRNVLPNFEKQVTWTELSTCSRIGRRLVRKYDITHYPTMIILKNAEINARGVGIDGVRTQLESASTIGTGSRK